MAWIYLAESVESHNPWRPGCEQLPTVKKSQVLSASYFPGCIEEKSNKPQSGMTLLLFEDQCFHQLTLSQEASHARISALQDFAAAWVEKGRVYSSILSGLQKKQRRQFYFSRMLKESAPSLMLSGLKLRSLAISAGMDLFPQLMSEQDTDENAGSYWPTLTASPNGSNQGGAKGRTGKLRLSLWSLWSRGKLPTPKASDYKRMSGNRSDMNRDSPSLATYWKATTGTTMPVSFCEWIMGYSIGATRSEPWATAWFRSKSKQHSEYYRDSRRMEFPA